MAGEPDATEEAGPREEPVSFVPFGVQLVLNASWSLVFFGLPDDIAIELLTTAMGTPYEISGASHLQAPLAERLQRPCGALAKPASRSAILEIIQKHLPA